MRHETAAEPAIPTVFDQPDRLLRRGLWLEYATLGWNVVGSVIVLVAAIVAGSVALAGFGLDSLIEIFASLVVVWHFKNVAGSRERRALRLIGLAFVGLAVYLSSQALYALLTRIRLWLLLAYLALPIDLVPDFCRSSDTPTTSLLRSLCCAP